MSEESTTKPLPVISFLKLPDEGTPYLEGSKCKECGAIYTGYRKVCSKCFARDAMETITLSTKGKLITYCIVYRSYPGIDVPFIHAVVDLEDGGTLQGNLIDIDPDPEKIKFDMPVDVVFQDALGRKDSDGNSYISYFFQPAQ
jgi:uncharacterized OB-fold protein